MAGSTALVTGASSGIGSTYADRLASRKCNLILVARDLSRLEAKAECLTRAAGVKVEVLCADLNDPADLLRVCDRLSSDGTINLLVNAAGLGPAGPVLAGRPEDYDAMVRLNVLALERLTLAAAQAMVSRRHGTIVNVASVVALAPERFNAVYAATKAFVLALTEGLRAELGPKGVQLQAVLPGITRTEIFERAGADISRIPPNMVMEVGDLVDAALAGLDTGETVTIPSLPEMADWHAFDAARINLMPNLSHRLAASRYRPGHEMA